MSSGELVAALEKLELQVAELSDDYGQHEASGTTRNAGWRRTAKENSEPISVLRVRSNDIDDGSQVCEPVSPTMTGASPLMQSSSPEEVFIEDLVEFGSHMPMMSGSVSEKELNVEESLVHDTGCDEPPKGLRIHGFFALTSSEPEEPNAAQPEYMHHEYKSVSITSDKYNEHPDPFAPALYSPTQLNFCRDFLYSPFAASLTLLPNAYSSACSTSELMRIQCSCERCFVMEVVLRKDPKEFSPLEPCVAARFLDEERRSQQHSTHMVTKQNRWEIRTSLSQVFFHECRKRSSMSARPLK
ncbi:hypothetical protein ACEPAH_8337 [Sanghuangporus vaninii]